MVAERAFAPALAGRHRAVERELARGDERVRRLAVHAREALAEQEAREQELGHVLGQRRDGRQDEGRRAADEDRRGQPAPEALGLVVVEAAALVDLEVHARRGRVVDLHAVHAEVGLPRRGVLGVDERQREERPAVAVPRRERGGG